MNRKEITRPRFGAAELLASLAASLGLAPQDLDTRANLLALGLDSIDIMGTLRRLRESGVNASLYDLYRDPTARGWIRLLEDAPRAAIALPADSTAEWPTSADGEPYALTPVQHAYLVGRSPQQALGGVGCHLYQEFDGRGLEASALQAALACLRERHPMLRTAFRADGTQRRLAAPSWPAVAIHDLSDLDEAAQAAALLALRTRLSHRLMPVEAGHAVDFQLAQLGQRRYRLFTNVDLLVADAASYACILDEIAALLLGEPLPEVDASYDFRSYLAQRAHILADGRERARLYWRETAPQLPPALALPRVSLPADGAAVRITRRACTLSATQWRAFRQACGTQGYTATMGLATCYAAVLARWTGQARVLLNLTLFDRHAIHPAVAGMVADFTDIVLVGMQGEGDTLAAMAVRNQQAFALAYEHHEYSGVEVLRDLRRAGTHAHGAPVVFTSNLGRPLIGTRARQALGEPGWGVSQTPQVWIDNMALQREDEVILQWDCNDALFPDLLTDTLFGAYSGLVQHLADHPQAWSGPLPELLPAAQRDIRQRANATAAPLPERLLHADVFEQARCRPESPALAHGDEQWTHGQLALLARRIGAALQERGVEAGARVGLCLPRGAGQIAAVLGTLYVGATYVPMDVDQPEARIERICHDAGLAMLIVCARDPLHSSHGGSMERLIWQAAMQGRMADAPVAVPPDQAAYVIYTSGSTGAPKGVVVSHRSALNTVQDLNRRYRVSSTDSALALSALHFDLSVYDIFGVLGAGGALVLVDENQRRDPAVWCERIARHGITLWNSVPALFDMLLTYASGCGLSAPSHLRLVFLSGDWISRDLPARYRQFRGDGRFVAMGGATEAAIWSNAQDVAEVPPAWPSIPYGFPLANQQYRVVDAAGRDCPDWVAGELWIGGAGVALGYHNDAERTARQFVQTATGRWYRSGDLGRYWPDGTLEFLGRRDKQVKIGGYRIELGEIDAAFHRMDGVCGAVTLALGDKEKSLASFVVLRPGAFERDCVADPLLPASYAAPLAASGCDAPLVRAAECAARAAALAAFLLVHLAERRVDLRVGLSASDAYRRYGCIAAMAPVLAGWLAWLLARGELTRREGVYRLRDGAGPGASPAMPEPHPALAGELFAHHEAVEQILLGHRPAATLLAHPFWSPEAVAMRMHGACAGLDYLRDTLASLAQGLRRAPRLIEIGARSGLAASVLLRQLKDVPVHYLALDVSPDMGVRSRERLAPYRHASARRWSPTVLASHAHSGDVVWANNSLHRHDDPEQAARDMLGLAAPGALLFIQEAHELPTESLVCIELLRGQQAFPTVLRTSLAWQALFRGQGAGAQFLLSDAPMAVVALRAPETLRLPDEPALRAALRRQLPEYMMPRRIQFLPTLPLTANGKVDAKVLEDICQAVAHCPAASEAPIGAAEQCLAALWRGMLENAAIDRDSDFFKLGGDSLLATRLIGMLAAQGYEVSLADLFAYPRLAACAAALHFTGAAAQATMACDHAARHASFPLTDLQQAYLVGRQPGFALGGIGSHFFVQFEVADLDVARLQQAWDGMIARHDMLRAVVVAGGQRVLPFTPPFVIQHHELASLADEQWPRLRDRLSHEVRDPACWPSFAVHVVQDGGPLSQVLISLDNLFLDGMSMQMLFSEMKARYRNPRVSWPEVAPAFRDYIVGQLARPAAPQAWEYWRTRLASLPAAPALPLRCDPETVRQPRFVRLEDHLPAQAWRALRDTAIRQGLTPSSLLLAAYAAVISAWSAAPAITLTLTLFDRRPVHPEIEQVMGDFTTLQLLSWHPHDSWLASARAMQDQMRQDLTHRDVSAIRVLRELARQRKVPAVSIPVVFTSALGYERDEGFLSRESWLKPVWGISQTPQTWLDLQVYEADGALYFNWDAVEALFEPDTLRAMFRQYAELLRTLAHDPGAVLQDLEVLVPRHSPEADPVAPVLPLLLLPALEDACVPGEGAYLAHVLAATVQVLGRDIAADQNFFDGGATSLNLVQLHALLRQGGCSELAVTDIFTYPSALALARFLGGRGFAAQTSTTADAAHARRVGSEARRARRLRRAVSP